MPTRTLTFLVAVATVPLGQSAFAETNDSTIFQLGSGNMSSIVQNGIGLNAGIWQGGQDNAADTTQSGAGHIAMTGQVGRNLDSSIAQGGPDRMLDVSIGVGDGNGAQGVDSTHSLSVGGVRLQLRVGR
ncbi:MAG: hypothetical protein ACU0BS_10545 [Hasllibacter sp.]